MRCRAQSRGLAAGDGILGIVVAISVSALCFAGCGGETVSPQPPWADQLAMHQVVGGWARCLEVDGPRDLAVAPRKRFATLSVPLRSGGWLQAGGERILWAGEGTPRALAIEGTGSILPVDGSGACLVAPVPVGAPRSEAPRRVLVMLADTLRADAVTTASMPEIVGYFRDGLRFTEAYSAATWTLPSVASLFTGRIPAALRISDGTLVSIPAEVPTMAEEMRAQGYRTAAVVANYTVNHENGFSRGFDLFYAPTVLEHGESPDAEEILRRADEIVEAAAGEDLFLYLHFMDPHDPYRNHETGSVVPAPSTGHRPAEMELEVLRLAYASEARHLSRAIGGFLERHPEWDLVLLTADHGEEFYEHGGFKHGPTVFPEVSRVPLLVEGRRLDRRGVVTDPASLIALKDAVVGSGRGWAGLSRSAALTETVVHAAPRWGVTLPGRQIALFARPVERWRNVDPIGVWLETHLPSAARLDLESGEMAPASAEELEAVAPLLGAHWVGVRPSVFIEATGDADQGLELLGVEARGFAWGRAEELSVTARDDRVAVSIRRPVGFILLNLAVQDLDSVAIVGPGGDPVPLSTVAPPTSSGGLRIWLDRGDRDFSAQGVQATLERLRSLGYI